MSVRRRASDGAPMEDDQELSTEEQARLKSLMGEDGAAK